MNNTARFARPACLGLSMILINACGQSGKDKKEPHSEQALGALSVPTPYSMQLDLDLDNNESDLGQLAHISPISSLSGRGSSHLQAMVYVSTVDSNIALPLRLPIKLLKAVVDRKPIQTETDTWTYSFDVLDNNRVWTANFIGNRLNSTATSWSMKVTSVPTDINGCCTDFLLFSGQSSASVSGRWQIFDINEPTESAKLFSIEYDYKSATERVILFTMNGTSTQSRLGPNSKVRFSVSSDLLSLDILDSFDQGSRVINWSGKDKSGEFFDPQKNRVCWDTYLKNFADVACK
jgi:hypothetical protein